MKSSRERRWCLDPGWWLWEGGAGSLWMCPDVRAEKLDECAPGMRVAGTEVWGLSLGHFSAGAQEDIIQQGCWGGAARAPRLKLPQGPSTKAMWFGNRGPGD